MYPFSFGASVGMAVGSSGSISSVVGLKVLGLLVVTTGPSGSSVGMGVVGDGPPPPPTVGISVGVNVGISVSCTKMGGSVG